MQDARFDKLAQLLVEYSTQLKRDETVLIEAFDVPDEMTIALVRAARKAGAIPFTQIQRASVTRELAMNASERQLNLIAIHELARMKKMDAYIGLRGSHNITELSDVPPDQMKLMAKKLRPVQDQRVKKTKWVVLRWPTPSMAQLAGMSTEGFEDFYFDVCTLDYRKLQPGMKALQALMDKTDRVEIRGPGTDLRFSIKGIGSIICGGDRNIPDGEVFSCPVRDSVEGHIAFNAPTIYQGIGFDGIRLEFREGKIVDASSNQTEKLNKILDSDPGARYIGEFSLAFNPTSCTRCATSSSTRRSRLVPLHAGSGLRRRRQRESQPGPLGHGEHPTPRLRRRRGVFRRQVDPPRRRLSAEGTAIAESQRLRKALTSAPSLLRRFTSKRPRERTYIAEQDGSAGDALREACVVIASDVEESRCSTDGSRHLLLRATQSWCSAISRLASFPSDSRVTPWVLSRHRCPRDDANTKRPACEHAGRFVNESLRC
jgi:aminopeptidase